jgi:hypothetical protein
MNYKLYENKLNKLCKNNQNAIFNDEKIITYAIGDLHGDLERLQDILLNIIKAFEIKDEKIIWKDVYNIYIIQVGDILNGYRKNFIPDPNYISNDLEIVKLLNDLDKQAIKNNKNCRIITLIGNHEIQNLGYIFSASFDHYPNEYERIERIKQIQEIKQILICNYFPYVIINNYLFTHNGIITKFIKYLKNFFNVDIKNLISKLDNNQEKINVLNKVLKVIILNINELANKSNKINKDLFYENFDNIHQYFYMNNYENENKDYECMNIENILSLFNVKGMIIGHVPQIDNNISIKCNGKLVKLDIYISRLYGDTSAKIIQVLKIENNKLEIIE